MGIEPKNNRLKSNSETKKGDFLFIVIKRKDVVEWKEEMFLLVFFVLNYMRA